MILLVEKETDGTLVDYKVGAELFLGFVVTLEKPIIVKCGVLKIKVLDDVLGKVDGVKTLVKTKTAEWLFHQTKGEQELKTCELLKPFCEGFKFLLLANFGNGEELAGLESEESMVFEKETEVHF